MCLDWQASQSWDPIGPSIRSSPTFARKDTISQQRRDSEISGKLISGMWMELACKRLKTKNWPGLLEVTAVSTPLCWLFQCVESAEKSREIQGSLFQDGSRMVPDGSFFFYGDGSKPWYLVNPKIAGKWMFIPLKMVLIGIDPYPYNFLIWPQCSLFRGPVSRSSCLHLRAQKNPKDVEVAVWRNLDVGQNGRPRGPQMLV